MISLDENVNVITFKFIVLGALPEQFESHESNHSMHSLIPSGGCEFTHALQRLFLEMFQGQEGTVVECSDGYLTVTVNRPNVVYRTNTSPPDPFSCLSKRDTNYVSIIFKRNSCTARSWALPLQDTGKLEVCIDEIKVHPTYIYFRLADGSEFRFYSGTCRDFYTDTIRKLRLAVFTDLTYLTDDEFDVAGTIYDDDNQFFFIAFFLSLSPHERMELLYAIVGLDSRSHVIRGLYFFLGQTDFSNLYFAAKDYLYRNA